MRIYTRTGDDGSTGLLGGARTSKGDERVEAYGTLDEANAAIGLARALGLPAEVQRVLAAVQSDLFSLGAELATVRTPPKTTSVMIGEGDIERLERAIDAAEDALPPLRMFILPGGTAGAAALHSARCIVRRAERHVVRSAERIGVRPLVVVYLNRLSDLLFVLSRRANQLAGVPDMPWSAEAARPTGD